MKKLLVTGAAGFIGSNFINYMLETRDDVFIVNLDKLTYAGNLENLKDSEDLPNYQFIKGDIQDKDLVDDIFNKYTIKHVINFAAESHVDRSILSSELFFQTNVLGTHVLLEASRKNDIERFIQVSTDEVYGSLGEEGVFTENTPLSPNSPYAASKASADLMALAFEHTYDLPVIVHIRDSAKAVLKVLENYKGKVRGVAHCFSQKKDIADILLGWGFYLGFGGPISYPKNDWLRDMIKEIPLDRILYGITPFLWCDEEY